MAENITFGINIPETNLSELNSGAFGNTANSTPSFTPEKPASSPAPAPSVETSPVNNVVDTNQLESNVGDNVSLPPEFVPDVFETNIPPVATPEDDKKTQEDLQKLEADDKRMREEVASGIRDLGDIADFTQDAEDDAGLQSKREAKTDIDNKLRSKKREFDLALRDANDAFGTRAQKGAIKSEITDRYNRRIADLSIIQQARAGEFNDAQATVDRKVELEMQSKRADLDALTFLFTENKSRLTLKEQREFDKVIKKEQRAYDEEFSKRQTFEQFKLSLITSAINNGAGNSVLESLQRAGDMGSLLSVKGVQGSGSGVGAPTVKSINGRDMQWDSATGQWKEIDTATQVSQVQNSVDQFQFLRDTVAQARKLAEDTGGFKTPVGPSAGNKAIGAMLVGNTTFKELQGLQDTIQTNMLTMSGDPNIRDFFGPQMSEADVRMMVSGGTTLNNSTMSAGKNGSYVKELQRIDDFLNRGQTGAKNKLSGINTSAFNVITAPDGTQVEIID